MLSTLNVNIYIEFKYNGFMWGQSYYFGNFVDNGVLGNHQYHIDRYDVSFDTDDFYIALKEIFEKLSANIANIGASKRIKSSREFMLYNEFHTKIFSDMEIMTGEPCFVFSIPYCKNNLLLLQNIKANVADEKIPKWMICGKDNAYIVCCCQSTFILMKLYYENTKDINLHLAS